MQVLSKHKNIIGIKEAVDDLNRVNDLISISNKLEKDFFIYSGDDPTFEESLELGTNGVISVAANVTPNSISNICALIRKGSTNDARELNHKNA